MYRVQPSYWICFIFVILIGYLALLSSAIQAHDILRRLASKAIVNVTRAQRGEHTDYQANQLTKELNGINEDSNIVKFLRNNTNHGQGAAGFHTGNKCLITQNKLS